VAAAHECGHVTTSAPAVPPMERFATTAQSLRAVRRFFWAPTAASPPRYPLAPQEADVSVRRVWGGRLVISKQSHAMLSNRDSSLHFKKAEQPEVKDVEVRRALGGRLVVSKQAERIFLGMNSKLKFEAARPPRESPRPRRSVVWLPPDDYIKQVSPVRVDAAGTKKPAIPSLTRPPTHTGRPPPQWGAWPSSGGTTRLSTGGGLGTLPPSRSSTPVSSRPTTPQSRPSTPSLLAAG
jgi:hypothetical protein